MPIDRSKQQWRDALQHPMAFARSHAAWTGVILAVALAEPALEHAVWGSHIGASGVGYLEAALANPLTYFSQRSPGARGSGALLQTKHRPAPIGRKAVKPHERVLANVRYAPGGLTKLDLPDDIIWLGLPPFEIPPPDISLYRKPPPSFVPPPIVIGPGPVPGPGPGPSPGAGGGPPPVPEPGTWAMLILGMFLTGAGLRATQRREAKVATIGKLQAPDAVPHQRVAP